MADLIAQAVATLWEPAEIQQKDIDSVLSSLLHRQIDLGELYFQNQRFESWTLEDGIVKDGGFSVDRGVGIRAISGEKTGFAYSDDMIMPSLLEAASAARSIAHSGNEGEVQIRRQPTLVRRYGLADPIMSLSEDAKVDLLKRVDAHARKQDSRVIEVTVRVAANHDTCLVVATDGTLAGDIRPLVRLDVSVIVEQNGKRERGSAGGGGRFDLGWFLEKTTNGEERALEFAEEAVRIGLVNLDAVAAPAGSMEVVLGAGWPGVLLHEAVGHGLEGDFNRKGSSAYSGRVGEQVASKHCTVVDDGTIDFRRGSLTVDDEGTPTGENVLIENGILKGYMQDRLNARLMGVAPTGNGRRQSYAHLPMPRMTNTFLRPGKYDPAEVIGSVKKGIYAVNFGGGQVDITSGRFVFSTTEAYLVENGKIGAPVKGATLVGNGPEVMNRVSMVANDFKLDSGVGVCGKDGQSVPVGVGQPTLKIDQVTVGGTAV